MDASTNITAAVFAAYLKCPTKAYLTTHGEKSPNTFFADTLGRISATYKARASQSLRTGSTGVATIDFFGLEGGRARDTADLFVDCETASEL
jgi:hypothetical protein